MPAFRCIPNTKVSGRYAGETASFQIVDGDRHAAQPLLINPLSLFEGLEDALINFYIVAIGFLSGNGEPQILSKRLYCLHKLHSFVLHEKGQSATALLAAKAMEKLFVRAD